MASISRNVKFLERCFNSQCISSFRLIKIKTSSSSILKVNMSTNAVQQYAKLPKLPVPTLQQTVSKYLRTAKPLLNENEFKTTQQITSTFAAPGGVGEKLHKMLEEKAAKEDNWLSEWWIHAAYLDYRLPVVVHSNPSMVFPKQEFSTIEDQLSYAAKLVVGVLQFNSIIEGNKMEQDYLGKEPLDMSQYKKLFNGCRVPGTSRDTFRQAQTSNHIVVVHNNHFFKMNVRGGSSSSSYTDILNGLLHIVRNSTHPVHPVGTLTTENRNVWGSVYARLRTDPTNSASLDAIETSMFVLCLDKEINFEKQGSNWSQTGHQLLHGYGSQAHSGNRWFDKTVQIIVGRHGESGLCFEHCPCEGPPIAKLSDYIVSYATKAEPENISTLPAAIDFLPFELKEDTIKAIELAKRDIDILASDLSMNLFAFEYFGKEDIKMFKFSPDSFIQVALQVAFIRKHGFPTAHYESASTRKFIHGRTEAIRTCLPEVVDFANNLLVAGIDSGTKYQAMQKAIKAHKDYVQWAINGEGVDRHLLGLKMLAIENGIDIPSIYLDVAYTKSTHWRVSTSQVAAEHDMVLCFGPVVPDGYGICYNPRSHKINIAVSSFNSNPSTSSEQLKEAIEATLIEMGQLASSNLPSKL